MLSVGVALVDLASVLAARAANTDIFTAADEIPSRGRFAQMTMSLRGSPTDLSGTGIECRDGMKLKVPFSWKVAFLFSSISLGNRNNEQFSFREVDAPDGTH